MAGGDADKNSTAPFLPRAAAPAPVASARMPRPRAMTPCWAPRRRALRTRALAILIGACGVLLTALVAAIAVQALTAATDGGKGGVLHL